MISLLGFMTLVGVYLAGSLKALLNKGAERGVSSLEVTLLVSITGYLIAGFFNNSVISVAPVFWVLLGLDMALLGVSAPGAGATGIKHGRGGDAIESLKRYLAGAMSAPGGDRRW